METTPMGRCGGRKFRACFFSLRLRISSSDFVFWIRSGSTASGSFRVWTAGTGPRDVEVASRGSKATSTNGDWASKFGEIEKKPAKRSAIAVLSSKRQTGRALEHGDLSKTDATSMASTILLRARNPWISGKVIHNFRHRELRIAVTKNATIQVDMLLWFQAFFDANQEKPNSLEP